jgi:hypothetical protein
MLIQALHTVSFDPSSEGRQHSWAAQRCFWLRAWRVAFSGLFSPYEHSFAGELAAFRCCTNPPSCVPFAPLPLRSFIATMDTLTPVLAGSSRTKPMNTRLSFSAQVSLFDTHHLPDHSAVNHPLPPGHRFNTLPLSVTGFRSLPERSGLRLCTAGSSRSAGRITFVILRTDRSPPVAPHPVSRRRSYLWLQAGERLPEEDFHLSDGVRLQAHGTHRFQRAVSGRPPIDSRIRLLPRLHAGSDAYRAPVSAHQQGGESPLQAGALRPVANGNCVVVRRGGEQPAANDQSVGRRT